MEIIALDSVDDVLETVPLWVRAVGESGRVGARTQHPALRSSSATGRYVPGASICPRGGETEPSRCSRPHELARQSRIDMQYARVASHVRTTVSASHAPTWIGLLSM